MLNEEEYQCNSSVPLAVHCNPLSLSDDVGSPLFEYHHHISQLHNPRTTHFVKSLIEFLIQNLEWFSQLQLGMFGWDTLPSLSKLTSIINSSPSFVWTGVDRRWNFKQNCNEEEGRAPVPCSHVYLWRAAHIYPHNRWVGEVTMRWRGQSNWLVLCICWEFIANLESDPCPALRSCFTNNSLASESYTFKSKGSTERIQYFAEEFEGFEAGNNN